MGTRAESSAQIVHAVDLHSLHFNNLRKKIHPFTLIKLVKTKYNTISSAWLRGSWETQPSSEHYSKNYLIIKNFQNIFLLLNKIPERGKNIFLSQILTDLKKNPVAFPSSPTRFPCLTHSFLCFTQIQRIDYFWLTVRRKTTFFIDFMYVVVL